MGTSLGRGINTRVVKAAVTVGLAPQGLGLPVRPARTDLCSIVQAMRKHERDWGQSSVLEHLTSMHKAMGSMPSAIRKKN